MFLAEEEFEPVIPLDEITDENGTNTEEGKEGEAKEGEGGEETKQEEKKEGESKPGSAAAPAEEKKE